MGFISGIYGLINSFMNGLNEAVMSFCAGLPGILPYILIPICFILLFVFGLLLMAWPLWIAAAIFTVFKLSALRKENEQNTQRLKTATYKISKKYIDYIRQNYPDITIDKLILYNFSIAMLSSNRTISVYFEKDLNFDLSGLPKMEIFFNYLASELITNFPLPGFEYVVTKTSQRLSDEVVGYNYTETDLHTYDNQKQVKMEPIVQSRYADNVTHEIVKKQSRPAPAQTPQKEVL